ncbi:MAG: hypothetical protein E7255_02545 [Lachnospiraceae bacterium]|nr:hypothetical protein [Lachnospiraceae bacterium]
MYNTCNKRGGAIC